MQLLEQLASKNGVRMKILSKRLIVIVPFLIAILVGFSALSEEAEMGVHVGNLAVDFTLPLVGESPVN